MRQHLIGNGPHLVGGGDFFEMVESLRERPPGYGRGEARAQATLFDCGQPGDLPGQLVAFDVDDDRPRCKLPEWLDLAREADELPGDWPEPPTDAVRFWYFDDTRPWTLAQLADGAFWFHADGRGHVTPHGWTFKRAAVELLAWLADPEAMR